MGREESVFKSVSMRLTVTRICLLLVVIITLALLGVFIFAVDPESLTYLGQWSFFALWFLFIQSITMLLLLSLAKRFLGEERAALYQGTAFRQSVFLSILITGMMAAQYFQVLTWWGVLVFIGLLLLIELTYRRVQSLKR